MFCWSTSEKKFGYYAVFAGFCVHVTLGTLYCFGNMNTYMTSYLRKYVHHDLQYSDLIWIPTLATMGQGLFMPISGFLEDHIGVRLTILVGSAIMTGGVYLTYFSIQSSLTATIFTYGFMFGLGTALAYAPPMAVAMKWFPEKKGVVNGIIVAGFGSGALMFNQIQTLFMNPNNKPLDPDGFFSDDEILDQVPLVFLMLGSIYGFIQFTAVAMITPPDSRLSDAMVPLVTHAIDDDDEDDEDFDEDADIDEELFNDDCEERILSSNVNLIDEENLHPKQIIGTREFWTLWMTFFLNTQAVTYINSMNKAFGQTFINDDHFLSMVGSISAAFNAGGRVFWGHMCDRVGYRVCMILVTLAIGALYLTLNLTSAGGKTMFALWIWAIFFSFCANFVLLPTATAVCFGTRHSSKNYGLVMTGQAFASPLTALMTQTLSPVIGFSGMFIIVACFSFVCTALTLMFPKQPSPSGIIQRINGQRANL